MPELTPRVVFDCNLFVQGIANPASIGFVNPLLVQSMYIFKQPNIGGEVTCHQDSTFIYTEPIEIAGLWFASKGSLILLHGLLPHRSLENTSDRSRHAYTLHLVPAEANYPANNWLQRPPAMPFRGF
jgi:phytanoyl-CoA hydroxylase